MYAKHSTADQLEFKSGRFCGKAMHQAMRQIWKNLHNTQSVFEALSSLP